MAKMICVRCGKREVAFLPNQEQLGGEPVLCQECGIENLLIQNKTLRADIEGVRKVAQEHINLKGAKDFSATHIAELLACHSTEVTKARQEPPKYYVGQLVWFLDKEVHPHHYGEIWRIIDLNPQGSGTIFLQEGSGPGVQMYLTPDSFRPIAIGDKVVTTGKGELYCLRANKQTKIAAINAEQNRIQLAGDEIDLWVEPEAVMLAEKFVPEIQEDQSQRRSDSTIVSPYNNLVWAVKDLRESVEAIEKRMKEGGTCWRKFRNQHEWSEDLEKRLRELEDKGESR